MTDRIELPQYATTTMSKLDVYAIIVDDSTSFKMEQFQILHIQQRLEGNQPIRARFSSTALSTMEEVDATNNSFLLSIEHKFQVAYVLFSLRKDCVLSMNVNLDCVWI